MPMTEAESKILAMRHEAHIAHLMGQALLLMIYQSEKSHSAHVLQTELVTRLGAARDCAIALANTVDPDKATHDALPCG